MAGLKSADGSFRYLCAKNASTKIMAWMEVAKRIENVFVLRRFSMPRICCRYRLCLSSKEAQVHKQWVKAGADGVRVPKEGREGAGRRAGSSRQQAAAAGSRNRMPTGGVPPVDRWLGQSVVVEDLRAPALVAVDRDVLHVEGLGRLVIIAGLVERLEVAGERGAAGGDEAVRRGAATSRDGVDRDGLGARA